VLELRVGRDRLDLCQENLPKHVARGGGDGQHFPAILHHADDLVERGMCDQDMHHVDHAAEEGEQYQEPNEAAAHPSEDGIAPGIGERQEWEQDRRRQGVDGHLAEVDVTQAEHRGEPVLVGDALPQLLMHHDQIIEGDVPEYDRPGEVRHREA